MMAKASNKGSEGIAQKVLVIVLGVVLTALVGGLLTFFYWLGASVVQIQVDGAQTKATGEATQANVVLLRKEIAALGTARDVQAISSIERNARRIEELENGKRQ